MQSYVDIRLYFNQLLEMLELVDLREECLFLCKNICNCRQLQNVWKTGENISPLQLTNNIYLHVYIEIQNPNQ
jgi:hypothetical protein